MKNISKVFGIITTLALIGFTALSLTACGDGGGGGGGDSTAYVITGGTGAYTLSQGGQTWGPFTRINDIINGIRNGSKDKKVTIQFGNGTTVLDIGSEHVDIVDSASDTWGTATLTLTGKITSSAFTTATDGYGTIYITSPSLTITSRADIANTDSGGGASTSRAIQFRSNGTLNITGGTISSNVYAVYNNSTGTVKISGGTVSSTSGTAVYNYSKGKIIVSGTANITSGNTNSNLGTIRFPNDSTITASNVLLEMTGGTVTNTSTGTGNAIYHDNAGKLNITGGKVSKAGSSGYAINNASGGVVTIGSGATIEGSKYGM